jgi:hypothetical protein
VLATAVISNAQAIVTLNLKDFPPEACEPLAIEPLHPDRFLLDLYGLTHKRSMARSRDRPQCCGGHRCAWRSCSTDSR